MSVPDNYQVISVTSTDPQIRVDIPWEYGDISELYIWQQDIDTGIVTYFSLGDFTVVEKSDGTGDYIEVQNVSTSSAIVNTARSSTKTQTYDLLNSEPLDPVALIEALDKAIKLIQEQDAIIGTPDRQVITSVNPFDIPDKVTRAGTTISFDENGDPVFDPSEVANIGYSKEWAVNPEDVLVSTDAGGNGVDEYSSLHYSKKSESSSEKAQLWAEEDEDVPVELGKYSSKHYALKAQESASLLINVKNFGAIGDGVSNDTSSIQSAIDYANSLGGGTVHFPSGVYRVKDIQARNNVECLGAFGSVVLKLRDGVDGQIFFNPDQTSATTVDFFSLRGMIFDGNKANALGNSAGSVVAINGVNYFSARDCIFRNGLGYGLAFQSYQGESSGKIGDQKEIYLENCHFLDNGDGVGGDTFDGIDVKYCDKITMIDCTSSRNMDKGFDLRGVKIAMQGCSSSENSGSGFELKANQNTIGLDTTANLVNCESNSNGGGGFVAFDGAVGSNICRVNMSNIISRNNLYGVQCPTDCINTELVVSDSNIFSNTSHGVTIGDVMRSCIIQGCTIRSNSGSGIYNSGNDALISNSQLFLNSRYGYEEGGSAQHNTLAGATRIKGNGIDAVLLNSNLRTNIESGVRSYNIGSGDIIASASTIKIPLGGSYFAITGSTDIDTITPTFRGHSIILQFASSGLTMTDSTSGGANLALSSDFVATSSDTISLVCDGANWFEMSRSNN